MKAPELAPHEPLSPELVLVLPPELRARVIAGLPAPVRPAPRRPAVAAPAAAVREPFAQSLAGMLVARVGQLALMFLAVTIITLAMSLVANAMR